MSTYFAGKDSVLASPFTVRSWMIRAGLALALTSAAWLIAFATLSLAVGPSSRSALSALISVSLFGTATVSYMAWPSRWNVPAHLQLAFGIVAYVLPVLVLNGMASVEDDVLGLYAAIVAAGFVATIAGVAVGGWISGTRRIQQLFAYGAGRVRRLSRSTIPRRLIFLASIALAMMIVSFAVMGFIPAFATNPYDAKFFRGEYGDRYAPVSVLYRVGTSALTTLLPALTLLLIWRRRLVWVALSGATVGTLLLTLQREPAVSGLLLAIGVAVAFRGRGVWIYIAALVGVYFVGSASYFVLAWMNIGTFSIAAGPSGILESVAAGAPDVADHVTFLAAWLADPVYANGWTFIGGLIPGNFKWNPAVWSLTVTNPGVPLDSISSGGFRLPTALWGFVNFGWAGALITSLLSGAALGLISSAAARYFRRFPARRLPEPRLAVGLGLSLLCVASLTEIASQLFALSYVSAIQTTLILAMCLVPAIPRRKSARSTND